LAKSWTAKSFFWGVWRNFEKISRVMSGEAVAVVESRSGFRYGKSEILKLLRVPRGSVRAKMRWARWRRRSVALQNGDWDIGAWASREGWQNHGRQNHFLSQIPLENHARVR
jgi:hypothetical protein